MRTDWNWTGLDWAGLGWTGLDWTGLELNPDKEYFDFISYME
jgi:hypothetical protein